MKLHFSKFHALGNDFLVVESSQATMNRRTWGAIARQICNRRTGVGADGILIVRRPLGSDCRADIFNSDGSWAEKSGNGLRIVAVYLRARGARSKCCTIEMGSKMAKVWLARRIPRGYLVKAELGTPDFLAKNVPVRSRERFIVNAHLKVGGVRVPATCLSVGNPHTVIRVNGFDFDWKALGRELEHSSLFPRGTNVEFVKAVNRRKLIVADWERGAGATGSSGTGAAAAVCAMVTLGVADRSCEVVFESGSLYVNWRPDDDMIELTGPVQHVMSGVWESQ